MPVEEAVEVKPAEVAGPRAPGEESLQHRLHHGAHGGEAVGGNEVDRPPHDRRPHRPPVCEEVDQFLRAEALQAAPEADVGSVGGLALHAGEALDGLLGRQPRPFEEHLPLERRPVEGPGAEDLHGSSLASLCLHCLRLRTWPSPSLAVAEK